MSIDDERSPAEVAASKGLTVKLPKPNELFVDIDGPVASESPPRPMYEPAVSPQQGDTIVRAHASVRCWPEGTR